MTTPTPEVTAAYQYVDSVIKTADGFLGAAPWWHGWALREAYLAGVAAERAECANDLRCEAVWYAENVPTSARAEDYGEAAQIIEGRGSREEEK